MSTTKRTYNADIAQSIDRFLAEDDWKYCFDADKGVFRFGVSIEGRMKKVLYTIGVNDDSFVVYAVYPLGGDPEDKDLMARLSEFLTRVNYGMKRGCFEMDWEDGEVRFKIFVDCDGILPSRGIILHSVVCPGMVCNRYADGIIDVIFRNASAREAVAKCEDTQDMLRQLLDEDAEDDGESGGDDAEWEKPVLDALIPCLDDLLLQAIAERDDPGEEEADDV